MQNKHFDLLVTAIWWTNAPELLKLFKRFEEVLIPDVRDPLGANLVTTATWWFLKVKISVFLQTDFFHLHPHIEQCKSSLVCW